MSAQLSALIPDLQQYARQLVDAAGAAGLMPRVTSTLRTRTQQARLYRDYLRGGRGFPVAPPGTSAHEFGYAFDMVVSPMEALWDVGQYWKDLGGVWGPGDAIHFEYPGFRQDLAAGLLESEQPPEWLTTAADIFNPVPGSTAASLAEVVGVDLPMVHALANPVETIQPYVASFHRIMKNLGLLY